VKIGDQLIILPNTMWELGHLTKECAQKLAHLEILKSFPNKKKKKNK
jgi:hypothetical protein